MDEVKNSDLEKKETKNKKKTKLNIWIIVLCFIFFAISYTSFELLSHRMHSWRQFTSPEGNFSVQMPGTPTFEKYPTNTDQGTFDINSYCLETKDATYWVNYVDYGESTLPKYTTEQVFRSCVDMTISNMHGRLLSESNISLDGYPGMELKIAWEEKIVMFLFVFI
jgi:hypothetical protein